MMVKNTWRKRLTAFINTANRYNHASPVIVKAFVRPIGYYKYAKGRNVLATGPVGASAGEDRCEECCWYADAVVCLQAVGQARRGKLARARGAGCQN
jgi:hypothetical protein